MSEQSDFGTFGRYQGIPVEEMSSEQMTASPTPRIAARAERQAQRLVADLTLDKKVTSEITYSGTGP
jgi:hypothetical protein